MTGGEAFILSEPVTSKTDNAPIALICYPLRKDGVPYGFINGAIALNRLTELARELIFTAVFPGSWTARDATTQCCRKR